MKKLQNNFTTLQQSKRLLELGVPAESADMYFQNGQTRPIARFANSEGFFDRNDDCSPCWSVGRLLEIYDLCASEHAIGISFPRNHIILDRVLIEFFGALQFGKFDFSKLED